MQTCKSRRSRCANVERWKRIRGQVDKWIRGRETGKERQCKGANVQRWKGDENGCQVTGDGEGEAVQTCKSERSSCAKVERGRQLGDQWKRGQGGGDLTHYHFLMSQYIQPQKRPASGAVIKPLPIALYNPCSLWLKKPRRHLPTKIVHVARHQQAK